MQQSKSAVGSWQALGFDMTMINQATYKYVNLNYDFNFAPKLLTILNKLY